jgi:hypothetical protein
MAKANAALPAFIAEYNAKFAVEPEVPDNAFVLLDRRNDFDTLLVVRYEYSTDNCGCFSFQNFTCQIGEDRPLVKKEIQFLFSEHLGFKVYYDKRYYPVELRGLSNSRKVTHLPDVTKLLLQKYYLANKKEPVIAIA